MEDEMDQETQMFRAIELRVYNSAVSFRIKDSAKSAATFLSQAENPFD